MVIPAIIGAVGSIGSSLIGGALSSSAQSKANAQNQANFEANLAFQSAEAEKARDWSEDMSNSAYQRAMKDMYKAGLNPMLAYQKGGASTPGASTPAGVSAPEIKNTQAISAGLLANGIQQAAGTAKQIAEISTEDARARLVNAQAAQQERYTGLHNVIGDGIDSLVAHLTRLTGEESPRDAFDKALETLTSGAKDLERISNDPASELVLKPIIEKLEENVEKRKQYDQKWGQRFQQRPSEGMTHEEKMKLKHRIESWKIRRQHGQ